MIMQYGEFEVAIHMGGHPVRCELSHNGERLMIDHRDLRDLEYAVSRMIRYATDSLPENYKHEVAR